MSTILDTRAGASPASTAARHTEALTVGLDRISVQAPAGPASAAPLDYDFPDYRRLRRTTHHAA